MLSYNDDSYSELIKKYTLKYLIKQSLMSFSK
nr:MAG TPA: hypothetical protein [Caudoviricetes sp.]